MSQIRTLLRTLVLVPVLAVVTAPPVFAQWWKHGGDVPYVPTPQSVVEAMLRLADVSAEDLVYDLGSGDGRIVITAAGTFGARAVGIDIDPERIAESRENARKAGVQNRVRFIQQDLFEADLGEATVVTLYLLSSVNEQLRPKLLEELAPGVRVVSHAFDMGEWQPEQSITVDGSVLYLWVVPAQVAGRWQGMVQGPDGELPVDLVLHQRFQQLDGMAVLNGAHLLLEQAEVEGRQVAMELTDGLGAAQRMVGTVDGDSIEGKVYAASDGRLLGNWQVTRAPMARPEGFQTIDAGSP